jgi:NAD+ kinase
MNEIKIISDQNKKSLKIKLLLKAKIEKHNFKMKNLLIVIGGDGFMLQTLKKYKDLSKKIYGINSGNYGFLMNKFSLKNIIKNLSKAKIVTISPLEMIIKNKKTRLKDQLQLMKFQF